MPFITHTLSSELTTLHVINSETLAAENLGITHCFMKPKVVQRPVIHPLSTPSNRFCATSWTLTYRPLLPHSLWTSRSTPVD